MNLVEGDVLVAEEGPGPEVTDGAVDGLLEVVHVVADVVQRGHLWSSQWLRFVAPSGPAR